MSFGKSCLRLFDRVLDGAAIVAGACLAFQVVSVTADVLVRSFFDTSIKAVIALNEWSLLYIAFLGAGWLQREAGHVSVDILLNAVGPRARAAAELFGIALGIAACGVLIWYGASVTWEKFVSNEYDYFKLEDFEIWPIYLVIPVGAVLWLVQLLRDGHAILAVRGGRQPDQVTDL